MRKLAAVAIILLASVATYSAIAGGAPAAAAAAAAPTGKLYSTRMVMTELHDGKTRTYAEPVLVARDGQPASYLAGGEVPINLGKTEYIEFGTKATITIHEMAPDQLRVCAYLSVSNLDTSTPGSIVIPETGMHLIKTIKPGESIDADLPGGNGRHVKVTIKPHLAGAVGGTATNP